MFVRTTVHIRPEGMLYKDDPRVNVIDEVEVDEDEAGQYEARKHGADAVARAIEKFKKAKHERSDRTQSVADD